jgi:hypothetical protein
MTRVAVSFVLCAAVLTFEAATMHAQVATPGTPPPHTRPESAKEPIGDLHMKPVTTPQPDNRPESPNEPAPK